MTHEVQNDARSTNDAPAGANDFSMKRKLTEHLLGVAFVSLIFLVLIFSVEAEKKPQNPAGNAEIEALLKLESLDAANPLHRALLRETLNVYYPDHPGRADSLLRAIDRYRAGRAKEIARKAGLYQGLSGGKLWQLAGMYLKFILAYLVVMLLTYYGVQTLAVLRFVRMKQNRDSCLAELANSLANIRLRKEISQIFSDLARSAGLLAKAAGKGIAYLVLFSPAYVIAYSFRTGFNTDTFFFLVLLGVISNGLLITYAQKFYTFLAAESRKGYVETAIVKGLHNNYRYGAADGISPRAILRWKKQFPGHVFQHIYLNARYQYLSTFKEQASFLITGLVIIEMALNIQGHLCYEMLQNILYKQFDVVFAIGLGIFWVVKATEIAADYWQEAETRKYENR